MTFQQAPLVLVWACFATLTAATVPAPVHEARQGPITIVPLTTGPGPASIQTSSSTSMAPGTTTKYATSSTSPLSSVTTSSATPQPSLSLSSLDFTVHNMTTCTSGVISWKYSGKEAELLLSITNIGVSQYDGTLFRFEARQSTVNTTILRQLVDTNTSALSWTWPSVNITQGWYEIQGLALSTPTVSNDSAPFFISNGTDVTCFAGTSPQSSSTASPSASAFQASAASKTNVASIVGGVIGGIIGVALAIIAGLCLWRRKRPFVGGGVSKDRGWGSLKSTNSSIQPGVGGAQPTSSHFHAHSESTGPMLQDVAGGKVSVTTTPGGSDEDVVVSEEKHVSPASSSGMSHFDTPNTSVHHDRRASTYSVQTPTTVVTEGSRSRIPSVRTSNQSLEQQAQRIRSSMETSTRRRSERLSMPTLPSPSLSRIPHSPTPEEYPLTPVTPTPVNRSISAGAVSMTARRTLRKPVPQYDSSILLEDKNADSASTFTVGAESSQSHGTGLGTGANGTPSDLVHKASFGDGRPVHYLIPDMPPPQRD